MHQSAIESYLKKLETISKNAPESFSIDYHSPVNWRVLAREDFNLYLVGKNLDAYNKILKDLLETQKWSKKFSEEYVDKVLQNMIFCLLRNGIKKAIEEFSLICDNVELYSVEQKVYIPLGGIIMNDIEALQIGKIQIKKLTEHIQKEIRETTQSIAIRDHYSSENQEFLIKLTNPYFELLSEQFSNKACIFYQIVAEPIRAKELAILETQHVLNLLRYSIPFVYGERERGKQIQISLSSQVPFSHHLIFILSSDDYDMYSTTESHDYEISNKNIEILNDIGVFKLSDIIKKPDKEVNDFEKTLLKGIQWFAISQTQKYTENEFLNLMTCLEVFFTQDKGTPITNSIAEGVALVLGENLTDRKKIKSKIKKLYDRRSELSHGGRNSILNFEIVELKKVAKMLLSNMIENKYKFKKRQDLTDWLEEKKLS